MNEIFLKRAVETLVKDALDNNQKPDTYLAVFYSGNKLFNIETEYNIPEITVIYEPREVTLETKYHTLMKSYKTISVDNQEIQVRQLDVREFLDSFKTPDIYDLTILYADNLIPKGAEQYFNLELYTLLIEPICLEKECMVRINGKIVYELVNLKIKETYNDMRKISTNIEDEDEDVDLDKALEDFKQLYNYFTHRVHFLLELGTTMTLPNITLEEPLKNVTVENITDLLRECKTKYMYLSKYSHIYSFRDFEAMGIVLNLMAKANKI